MKSSAEAHSPFRNVRVPTSSGARIKKATGTTDRVVADLIADMVTFLSKKHAWDVLDLVTSKPERQSLKTLYAMWTAAPSSVRSRKGEPLPPSSDERLEFLRNRLTQTDVEPLIDRFKAVMLGPVEQLDPKTVDAYVLATRSLIPAGVPFWSVELTVERLVKWKNDLGANDAITSSNTVIRKCRGVGRFLQFLKDENVIAENPMDADAFKLPSGYIAQPHYVDTYEAQMLADAQSGWQRNYSALLAGTGIETTVLFNVRRSDVDLSKWEIRAPGNKTYNRDRVVMVATWARPYLKAACEGKTPNALVFDPFSERSLQAKAVPTRAIWWATDSHERACEALAAKGHRKFMFLDSEEKRYTQRDQRHTWAVYAVRGGWPIEAVSRQLGHKDAVMALKIYGRFMPTGNERAQWERLADLAATARHEEAKSAIVSQPAIVPAIALMSNV